MSFSDRFARLFQYLLPSPFTLAVLLSMLTFALALAFTEPLIGNDDAHVMQLFGHWSGGIWSLLEFAMQMMLMLVLGHVLALSPPMRWLIDQSLVWVSDKSTAAFVVTLVTILVAFFNWGLGLIVGAILARKVGEYAAEKGIAINYGLIGAAGYSGLMVWHGGLSGSAPLKAAQEGHQFADLTAGAAIDITYTTAGTMNLVISGAILVILPLAMFFLARFSPSQVPEGLQPGQAPTTSSDESPETLAERLDFSRILSLLFGGLILFLFLNELVIRPGHFDPSKINPNLINLLLFGMCLVMHPHFRSFLKAVDQAISGSTGIMIQFPLYAGIMGIMKGSGLAQDFSYAFANISTETTFPIYTMISAGVVNVFVPSGGGQWGVQGGIVLEAAATLARESPAAAGLGAEELDLLVKGAQAKGIMALSYGDQLTNMMQPFWALPLLGITGLKARQILPYTLFLMLVGGLVYGIGLMVF